MKKMKWKNCLTTGATAVLALSLLAGCGASQTSGSAAVRSRKRSCRHGASERKS